MRMNPNIPMMGQTPDLVGTAARGFQAGRQNALADVYKQHGAGIANGEKNALNMLASFNPEMAMKAKRDLQVMAHADAQEGRLQRQEGRLDRQEARAIAQMAANLSEAERAAEVEQIKQGVAMGMATLDEEEWNTIMEEYAPPLVGEFPRRHIHANRFLDIADVIKQSGPGYTIITGEEAEQLGLDPAGVYNKAPNGKVSQIGGSGPLVDMSGASLGNKGESEYDKARGKSYAAMMGDFEEQGASARRSLYAMDAMEDAMNAPGFYSGIGAGTIANVKRLSSALGWDADGIADMEAFNSQAKAAALDAMGGSLGAGFSNADRDFVEEQVAGLKNTPEGNRKIIEIQRKLQQRKIDIMHLAQEYERKNRRLDAGFSKLLEEWANENPLFGGDQSAGVLDFGNMSDDELKAWISQNE